MKLLGKAESGAYIVEMDWKELEQIGLIFKTRISEHGNGGRIATEGYFEPDGTASIPSHRGLISQISGMMDKLSRFRDVLEESEKILK